MAAPAIEAHGLRRSYYTRRSWTRARKQEIPAVTGLDLEVERGELFGLLGPNGAGKTTTIRMLCSLLVPTDGQARVCGYDVVTEARAVRQRIGYVFGGDRGLYDRLSALDNLRYFAELAGVPSRQQAGRIAELLDRVNLTGRERERVQGYSRGMKQRLHIARGLLAEPAVLFLDEPTIGVDPLAGRDLRRLVAELAAGGTTVLMTTHYMAEADELCGRIGVIVGGRLIALGAPADLKAATGDSDVVELEVYGAPPEQLAALELLPGVRNLMTEERGAVQLLTVQVEPGWTDHDRLRECLTGSRLGRLTVRAPSLEDAYISIVSAANQGAAVPVGLD